MLNDDVWLISAVYVILCGNELVFICQLVPIIHLYFDQTFNCNQNSSEYCHRRWLDKNWLQLHSIPCHLAKWNIYLNLTVFFSLSSRFAEIGLAPLSYLYDTYWIDIDIENRLKWNSFTTNKHTKNWEQRNYLKCIFFSFLSASKYYIAFVDDFRWKKVFYLFSLFSLLIFTKRIECKNHIEEIRSKCEVKSNQDE